MRYREVVAYGDMSGLSIRQVEHRMKMLRHATTRYNSLVRTLAAVRRVGLPAVQVVNVGGQNQTNIAGTS